MEFEKTLLLGITLPPLVTVLITSFNRVDLLKKTVASVHEFLDYPKSCLELVLADDGSDPDQQSQMQDLGFDKLVLSPTNTGLGANINRGQSVSTGEFLLYLQDDFPLIKHTDFIWKAVALMRARQDVGIVRLFDDGDRFCKVERYSIPGAAETARIFHPPKKNFLYTDLPHIKSRVFMEFIGPYLEVRHMQSTERNMQRRFGMQTRFLTSCIEGYFCVDHIGENRSWRKSNPTIREQLGKKRRLILQKIVSFLPRNKG